MGRQAIWAALALALVVLGAVGAWVVLSGGSSGRAAWFERGDLAVAGPVAAGNNVLAVVQRGEGRHRNDLWLESRDVRTGALRWRAPAEFSEITAGVVAGPIVADGVVLALVPDIAGTVDVHLQGRDVGTGRVRWSTDALVVEDAPASCPSPLGDAAFCVVTTDPSTSATALTAYDARSGHVLARVPAVRRQIGPGVYELDTTEPRLGGVATPGGIRWSRPVSSLFAAGYAPNYGWIFETFGRLDVGSVGAMFGLDNDIDVSTAKTVGVDAATGAIRWRLAAELGCGDVETRAPFVCFARGTIHWEGDSSSASRGASLVLGGLDPQSGRVAWRRSVSGLADYYDGTIAIADDDHLLVHTPAGRPEVLDLRTGVERSPASGETFWCQQVPLFHVPSGYGADPFLLPDQGPERVSAPRYRRCDASGRSAAGDAAHPALVGARTDGMFVWAGLDGLHATPL